jgi:dethiobiotin synthetase
LLRALRQRGLSVNALKPMESGVSGSPADTVKLMDAAGIRRPISQVCGWTFPEPVAPAEALRERGLRVTTEAVADFVRANSAKEFTLVETAGGLLSPYASDGTCLDLAVALEAPVILVAPNTLGVINQSRMALDTVQSRSIRTLCLVLNEFDGRLGPDAATNAHWIESWSPDVPLVTASASGAPAALVELVMREVAGSSLM